MSDTQSPSPLMAESPTGQVGQSQGGTVEYTSDGYPIWPVAPEWPQPSAETSQPTSRKRAGLRETIGNLALLGVVIAELSPLNEIVRFGLAGAVGYATGSPEAAAGTLAASTVAVEGLGAVATARLMQTEMAQGVTRRANRLLKHFRLDRLMHSNFAMDTAAAAIVGVPAVLVLKHQQDPSRTFEDDVRYGMELTLASSAIVGTNGYAVARGIVKAGSLPVIGGIIVGAGAAYLGVKSWVNERLARRGAFTYEEYAAAVQNTGPQLRGYQPQDYQEALTDERTRTLTLRSTRGQRQWPLLSPIENNTDYDPRAIREHFEEGTPVYYLSLPSRELLLFPKVQRQLARILHDTISEGAQIVFDQMNGEDTLAYLQMILSAHYPGESLNVDSFVDPAAQTPAASIHYHATIVVPRNQEGGSSREEQEPNTVGHLRAEYHRRVDGGQIDLDAPNRNVVIDPENLDVPISQGGTITSIDRLWEIYRDRFTELGEAYPARVSQTRAEFDALLRDPQTLIVAHVVGGEIAAFTYVTDVRHCEWLNPQYYEREYGDGLTLYFPGIAADREHAGSSMGALMLVTDLVAGSLRRVNIVFQCTNVSQAYVPKLANRAIAANRALSSPQGFQQGSTYRYYAVQVTVGSQQGSR